MTPAQLASAIRKRPFVPYAIRTTSGEVYHVDHPEAIWQAKPPEESTIILQDKKAGVVLTDTSCIAEVVLPPAKRGRAARAEQ